MLTGVNGPGEQFLTDLDQIQSAMNTVQRQLSSGLRVGQASDDPSAVPSILNTQSEIAQNNQAQSTLNQVGTELKSGDSSLQQAVALLEKAITLASQAGSTVNGNTQIATLAGQVQDIQEQLVSLSNTSVGGRFIFSGDDSQQAAYALDSMQPNGVRQLAPGNSTLAITDTNGNTSTFTVTFTGGGSTGSGNVTLSPNASTSGPASMKPIGPAAYAIDVITPTTRPRNCSTRRGLNQGPTTRRSRWWSAPSESVSV